MNETERALLEFIRVELLEDATREIAVDDELLLDEIVDSLGVMRIVAYVEERTGLEVPAEDVTIENFATIGVIANYIQGRAQAVA